MPMTPAASPRETAEGFLRAAISPDPGEMAGYYAPSVVIEMPFAVPALYPARIEATREELRTRFRAGAQVRRYHRLSDVVIHETADPEVVIAEYQLHGELVTAGGQFTLQFLMVLTIRDGVIVHSRDYADPIRGAQLLGRIPELLAALGAAQAG